MAAPSQRTAATFFLADGCQIWTACQIPCFFEHKMPVRWTVLTLKARGAKTLWTLQPCKTCVTTVQIFWVTTDTRHDLHGYTVQNCFSRRLCIALCAHAIENGWDLCTKFGVNFILIWIRNVTQSLHHTPNVLTLFWVFAAQLADANDHCLCTFFPRASERRVFPIVGACQASSHLHIFSSSHLLIFTSSHLHIFSSSHPLILTSSHLHILTSSHLLIFTSSIFHIFSSSHLLIFTSSHLHIFSSSHLLIFISSHPHILTSSHPHIFTSSHLHILTSSYLHIFTFSLALLLSCRLALLPSCYFLLFYFCLEGAAQCQQDGTKRNPFARHEVRSPKAEVKLRFPGFPSQPFRTKWGSIAKNWGKIAISHDMHFHRKIKTDVKLRFPGSRRNPFARNEVS